MLDKVDIGVYILSISNQTLKVLWLFPNIFLIYELRNQIIMNSYQLAENIIQR